MSQDQNNRWYEKDPQLKSIMRFLEKAPEDIKQDVAKDIVQLVIQENFAGTEEVINHAESNFAGDCKRWYDTDDVVHTAIEMLKLLNEHELRIVLREIADTILFFSTTYGVNNEGSGTGSRRLPDKQD